MKSRTGNYLDNDEIRKVIKRLEIGNYVRNTLSIPDNPLGGRQTRTQGSSEEEEARLQPSDDVLRRDRAEP